MGKDKTEQPDIKFALLGSFIMTAPDGEAIGKKLNRKTRALLAYLLITRAPQTRTHLADIFCQESKDPAGTLRWHLSRIRRELHGALLISDRQQISLNSAIVETDLWQLEQAAQHIDIRSLHALEPKLLLFKPPLISDLSLPDAPEYELWLLGERSRTLQLFERSALAFIERGIEEAEFASATRVCQRLIQVNPLLERAHAHLIWLYAYAGQRQHALAHYEQCRQLLEHELGIEPGPEIEQVMAAVRHQQTIPAAPRGRRSRSKPDANVGQDYVGRTTQLQHLTDIWEASQINGGRVVLISAPAGGGKTRFVQEFMQRLPSPIWRLSAHGYESTRQLSFQPWLALLEDHLIARGMDHIRSYLPDHWRRQASIVLPQLLLSSETPPQPNRGQVFQALRHLLFIEPTSSPRIIFIDDLQWADEESLQLFHFLANHIQRTTIPILLVGTYRVEEIQDSPALATLIRDIQRLPQHNSITLPPLSTEEITELIDTFWKLSSNSSKPIPEELWAATQGNPLFTVEILQEFVSSSAISIDFPLPPSLAALVNQRLASLPGQGRQVIEALAIFDQPTPFTFVQEISGRSEEETVTAIELGLRWRLLQQIDALRIDFSHDLMRTVTLSETNSIRRHLYHRRAAISLEQQQTDPAQLAYHWGHAGDKVKEGHYAALAGKQAASIFANTEAERFFLRAKRIVDDPREKSKVIRQLIDLWVLMGKRTEAQALCQEGIELAASAQLHHELARYQTVLGRLLLRQGHYRDSLKWMKEASAAFHALDDLAGVATAEGDQGLSYWYLGENDLALAQLQKRLDISTEIGDQESAGIAIANMGIVYWSMGRLDEALTYYQKKRDIDQQTGDRLSLSKVYGNMGLVYVKQGRFAEALQCYEHKLHTDLELGDREGVCKNLSNTGQLYARVGRSEALEHLCLSLQIALDMSDAHGVSVALGNLLRTYLIRKELDVANDISSLALEVGRTLNSPYFLSEILSDCAELKLEQNNLPDADQLNREALSVAKQAKHTEMMHAIQFRQAILDSHLARLTPAEAIEYLHEVSSGDLTTSERAAQLFTAWRLRSNNDTFRTQAAELYRDLFAKSPDLRYKQRYQQLTGHLPPPPPSLPTITLPKEEPIEPLSQLLQNVSTFLEQLSK